MRRADAHARVDVEPDLRNATNSETPTSRGFTTFKASTSNEAYITGKLDHRQARSRSSSPGKLSEDDLSTRSISALLNEARETLQQADAAQQGQAHAKAVAWAENKGYEYHFYAIDKNAQTCNEVFLEA